MTDNNSLWNSPTKTIIVAKDYGKSLSGTRYIFNDPCHGLTYTVTVVSNSSLTNFNFNYSLKQASFNVTGSATRTAQTKNPFYVFMITPFTARATVNKRWHQTKLVVQNSSSTNSEQACANAQ